MAVSFKSAPWRERPWVLHNVLDKFLGVLVSPWCSFFNHQGTKARRDTEVLPKKMKIQPNSRVVQHLRPLVPYTMGKHETQRGAEVFDLERRVQSKT